MAALAFPISLALLRWMLEIDLRAKTVELGYLTTLIGESLK